MSSYDRLAPMRLYTLSKRHFVLVFVCFLICFGLTVFIGITGMSNINMSAILWPKLGVILTQVFRHKKESPSAIKHDGTIKIVFYLYHYNAYFWIVQIVKNVSCTCVAFLCRS